MVLLTPFIFERYIQSRPSGNHCDIRFEIPFDITIHEYIYILNANKYRFLVPPPF